MTTLLQALLRNESGGRNVTNVHQSTSSGRARGFFQITDGTWAEFGGRKYAPTALQASYEQQAEIASRIPLRRWDESTVALMRATGRPIDPNRTLGENLAMNQESFAQSHSPRRPADQFWPDSGQAQLAASQGYGGDIGPADSSLDNSGLLTFPLPPRREETLGDMFAKTFGDTGSAGGGSGDIGGIRGDPHGEIPPLDYAPAGPATSANSSPDFTMSPLAQLFNLKTIGQPPMPNLPLY